MKVELVSHASVRLETVDRVVLTDPWFAGRVFNDSWQLVAPPPGEVDDVCDGITDVWISHEHPDHFHPPTLRSIGARPGAPPTVWFQRNNSAKVPDALAALGFGTVRRLRHREMIAVGQTRLYCYHVGHLDSVLAVTDGHEWVLNVNDAEVNRRDCERIRADLGSISVVLNQFSLAGYDGAPGAPERLEREAARVLDNVVENHRDLGARLTVPVASFVHFCAEDNQYVNQHVNQPVDVLDRFASDGLDCVVLRPGGGLDPAEPEQAIGRNSEASAWWADRYAEAAQRPPVPTPTVTIDELVAAAQRWRTDLLRHFPGAVLRRALPPIDIDIDDLSMRARLDVARPDVLDPCPSTPTPPTVLVVRAQPLLFALTRPFGFQTLGVSGRYRVEGTYAVWTRYRVLTSMRNAEVTLAPKHFLSAMPYAARRARGGLGQLRHRLGFLRS